MNIDEESAILARKIIKEFSTLTDYNHYVSISADHSKVSLLFRKMKSIRNLLKKSCASPKITSKKETIALCNINTAMQNTSMNLYP